MIVFTFALRVTVLWFAGFLLFWPPLAHALDTVDGAPEGFETISQPRRVMLNLSYGGNLLGSFMAHYTAESVYFDEPAKIVAEIPALKDAEKIKSIIGQPMPLHADLVCGTYAKEGCGTLNPDVAGVIFNEQSLSADLFINRTVIGVTDDGAPRYLPLPEKDLSSIYNLSGAVNGMNSNKPNFNVANNATFSLGEAMLNAETSVSDNGLRFNTATAGVERNGWRGMGGLFRTRAMKLITDRDILGLSFGTSLRTRLDQQRVRGNDVILYLPRRSFVSLYREGRLYSSRAYDAGNQQVDTSELPEGAYNITIRIQDTNGTTREEQRFFAKTEELPPPDSPLYLVQGGIIRKPVEAGSTLPELTGKPILRAGTIRRLSDNVGLTVSTMTLEDRAVIETGPFIMIDSARIGFSGLSSTKGDYGVQASYTQAMSNFSVSADMRRFWASPTPMPGFDDMAMSMTQASATISYAITSSVIVGAKSNYTARDKMDRTISAGPYAQWNIWQRGESMLIADATMSRTAGQNEGNAMLRFSHKFGQSYGVSGSVGQLVSPDDHSPQGNIRAWHEDTSTPGERLLIGAGLSGDKLNKAVSADADWENSFGEVRGGVQQAFGKNGSNFSYGGNFSVNAAQLKDEVHLGGTQSSNSAIIVETDGDSDMPMKVKIDGIDRAIVKRGERQVIYLNPFHTYRVSVRPSQPGLVDYGDTEKKVTLYPGNVAKLHWSINKFYVVVGKIVDANGAPLADALLQEGDAQIATDSNGRVQAELAAPKKLTFSTGDNQKCVVDLPAMKDLNGVLIYKQPLTCKGIS